MLVYFQPPNDLILQWIDSFVPDKDLFFISEHDLVSFKNDVSDVLIIPCDEFYNHASYKQIQMNNSYEYWNISKDVHYVIVAQPNWILNLQASQKLFLFKLQVMYGRGLIFPCSYFKELPLMANDFVVQHEGENFLVLQYALWNQLSKSAKEMMIKNIAFEWDDWNSFQIPDDAPCHIKKFAHKFSAKGGANCLAAVLYAISDNPKLEEWLIEEWIHPKTFALRLKTASYYLSDGELEKGDVVVWLNIENDILHAAYYLGDKLFFNKNGQTFFQPWKIVNMNTLLDMWDGFVIRTYRKQ